MAVTDPAQAGRERVATYAPTTGPSGWVVFAATMLCIAGFMRILDAIWAFRYNGHLPENLEDAIFGRSLTTYGWIYLIVAAILIGTGILVLSRSEIARWVGIAAAGIMAIIAVPWLPYYPVWSLVYIGTASLVVYALAVHAGPEAS